MDTQITYVTWGSRKIFSSACAKRILPHQKQYILILRDLGQAEKGVVLFLVID